jgi:dTDP-D-glucose 4,6-dehydratase
MTLLVTGCAGFIGSNFVLDRFSARQSTGEPVVTLDALTYAGNPENLAALCDDARHTLGHGDICDWTLQDDTPFLHKTTDVHAKACVCAIVRNESASSTYWPLGMVCSTPDLAAKDVTTPLLEEVLCT